jgi:DNA-binding phage protein
MSKAFGGVSKLAERAEPNLNMLYRTLSAKENGELKSLLALREAMRTRLTIRSRRKHVA